MWGVGGWLDEGAVFVHGRGHRASPPTPTRGAGGCWVVVLVGVSTTAAAAPSVVLSHTPTVTAPLKHHTNSYQVQVLLVFPFEKH